MFGIAVDILVVGYDSNEADYDKTLLRVLQICRKDNLNLYTNKCHFRCPALTFFGEIISRQGMRPDPRKLKAVTHMPAPNELQAYLDVLNYLSKFSPVAAEVCKSLRQFTLIKTEYKWNGTYQQLFNKAKTFRKEDTCMKFYDERRSLYLETDACGIDLGVKLINIRDGMNCPQDEAPHTSIL